MKKNQSKKSKIPYFFFAFFFVIIAVNIGYIYIAKKTWRGVTTDESYQKGLGYNQILEQEKKQRELGWIIDSKASKIGDKKMLIYFNIKDSQSRPIHGAKIFVNFKNPVQEGADFSVSVSEQDQVYQTEVSFPSAGQWEAITLISYGKDETYVTKRYIVQ